MKKSKSIYRWTSLFLFLLEVCIALFVPSQSFIRHSLGDFIVVILLYSLVRSFVYIDPKRLAIAVLIFAFAVEFSQYMHLVEVLGIQQQWLKIIMGTQFSFADLMMYTLGCLTTYGLDRYLYTRIIGR
jgi:hypothetical protein